MVLGLKPMGKPTIYQNQVLDRTKVLHGPRTQTYGETNYLSKSSFGQDQGIAWSSDSDLWESQLLKKNSKSLSPRTKYQKRLRLGKLLGKWRNALLFSDLQGLFIFGYISSDDYFLHCIEHFAIISFKFGVYNPFSGWSYCTRYLQYVHDNIFSL